MFWSAGGIEFLFTGSEIRLEYHADYESMEPWIGVELDGARIIRLPLNRGDGKLVLFRGMTVGVPKHVRILKETQAMNGDPRHLLQLKALAWGDGEFLPLPEAKYRMEFIGDSITSGEGAIGAQGEEDWISAFFSVYPHYARLTADAFAADFRLISQSGWGVYCGWDNNPHSNLPAYYTQICGLASGKVNEEAGAFQVHDFSSWQPDVVIINLGTNDMGAFDSPPWQDPLSGKLFKQRRLPDGRRNPEDETKIVRAAVDFLALVREHNPHALLLWVYGMLDVNIEAILQSAFKLYLTTHEDERIRLLRLPAMTAETMGARKHPGAGAHQAAAARLCEFLEAEGFEHG